MSTFEREQQFRGKTISYAVPKVKEIGIVNENVPYKVIVDRNKLHDLYTDMGFSEEQINKININIKRKFRYHPFAMIFGGDVLGAFNFFTGNTTIYTDWFLKRYERDSKIAERIATKNERIWPLSKKDERRIQGNLTTKRIVNYLKNAPPERSIPFAKKTIYKGYERLLNDVILHEETHRRDHTNKTMREKMSLAAKIGTVLGTNFALNNVSEVKHITGDFFLDTVAFNATYVLAAIAALRVEYSLDPMERSANNFMGENSRNPKYERIVQIFPKHTYTS